MFLSGVNLGITTLKDNDLTLNESTILLILWSFENKGKTCILSRNKIAEYLNESKSTIARAIKSLKAKGFIYCIEKSKSLSSKGLGYCKEVFIYPKQKKNNESKAIVPEWYDKYQADIEKQEQEKLKTQNHEITQEMIDATNAFPD